MMSSVFILIYKSRIDLVIFPAGERVSGHYTSCQWYKVAVEQQIENMYLHVSWSWFVKDRGHIYHVCQVSWNDAWYTDNHRWTKGETDFLSSDRFHHGGIVLLSLKHRTHNKTCAWTSPTLQQPPGLWSLVDLFLCFSLWYIETRSDLSASHKTSRRMTTVSLRLSVSAPPSHSHTLLPADNVQM